MQGEALDRARLHPDVLKNLSKNKKLKAAESYSEDNPPPYPVTKVNGTTGDVTTHLVETVGVTFSSGRATVAAKSGYYLVNAYANNRPTSETANQYSIASIQRLTNGQYYLRNVEPDLSASLNVVLIWVKG